MALLIFGLGFTYSQIENIPYSDLNTSCDFKSRPAKFIIENQEEFKELSNCNLRFDFDKYIIIGVQGTSPGHFIPIIDFKILKNDSFKKIVIEVTISGGKACNCRVSKPFYRRILYIDKLEDNYEYEFNYIFAGD